MATNLPAVGSYLRYKNDTEIFMTWVSQAAQACGHTSSSGRNQTHQPSSVTPKSATTGREKNSIPVKEILVQAKAIVGTVTPFIRLPASIERAAQNAINMRKQFTARFLEPGGEVSDSNSGHLYFVNVLQEALGLLKGRNSKAKETTGDSSPDAPEELITNRFNLLEVEDFEDAEAVASHFEKTSATTKTTSRDPPKIVTPDCSKDADLFLEMVLSVFFFFDDLHQIQEHLQKTWLEYKNGQKDLLEATIITNAALSLVEQAEADLINSWPDVQLFEGFRPQPDFPYQCFVLFFRPQEIFRKDDTRGHIAEITKPESLLTALADYIYADSFWTIRKYAASLQDAQRHEDVQNLEHNTNTGSKLPFPRIPRLVMRFREARELFGNPKFQTHDIEDEALTQLLIDTFFKMGILNKKGVCQMPRLAVVDEFTKAMMNVKELKLTTHAVFAATVMKNIHRILGTNVAKCYDGMKALAEECQRLIWHVTPQAPRGMGPYWREHDMPFVNNIIQISNYILKWPIGSYKTAAFDLATKNPRNFLISDVKDFPSWASNLVETLQDTDVLRRQAKFIEFYKSLSDMGIRYVAPANDPLLVYRGNPLLCGTIMLNLTLAKEQAGIALANHHLSLLYTTYIYNALQQKEIMKGTWPELENVINGHVDSLFFGSRPTTLADIMKKFELRTGLSPSQKKALERMNAKIMYQVQSLGGDGTTRKGISPSCLSITETSKALGHYFAGEQSFLHSIHSINTLIQKSKPCNTTKRTNSKFSLEPRHFIEDLPKWLSGAIPIITTDYITLTRRCNEILQSIINSNLIAFRPAAPNAKIDEENLSVNNNFFHITHQILAEGNARVRAERRLQKRNLKIANMSDLEIAGTLLEEYLKKKEFWKEKV